MTGYLIAEEGPLIGLVISFEEGEEWVLGRDVQSVYQTLEDPQVSRRHAIISKDDEHFQLENLSSTNPASINGQSVTEVTTLHEGDIVQLGTTLFRFTEIKPEETHILESASEKQEEEGEALLPEEIQEEIGLLSLAEEMQSRWLLKVISGPNTGAEFGMQPNHTYILGKDSNICDIFLQDLSVSRQHAKIILNEEGSVIIEDLDSRNGVLVNGNLIEKEHSVHSQDLISLGTTSFLIIDREQTRETLFSPPPTFSHLQEAEEAKKEEEIQEQIAMRKSWKEMFIPTRHLVLGGALLFFIVFGLFSIISLFKTTSVTIVKSDQVQEIEYVLKKFPAVEYNYNADTGKLFLLGHVLTDIDHQEMVYMLRSLPYISSIDDNVIIDEYVWEDMNALLFKNPDWRSVLVVAPKPGKFILKGYLKSSNQVTDLMDYVNNNFPYLDRLTNEVVVENTLETKLQSILIEKGFVNVSFQLAGGELLLTGRVTTDDESDFKDLVDNLKKISGIKEVKNYVIYTGESTARINVSSKYKVTGTSKHGNENQFVMIDGKILSKGDALDGMMITGITTNSVLLEKDGLKYKIDYNL